MKAIFVTFLTLVSSIVFGFEIGLMVKFNGSFHVTLNKTESLKVNSSCESLSIIGQRDINGKYSTQYHCNIPEEKIERKGDNSSSWQTLKEPKINKDALDFETGKAWSTYNHLTDTIEAFMSANSESSEENQVKSEEFNTTHGAKDC